MEKSAGEKVRKHIPDDLAFSILSKLPLKSLKRFGCVRKSWSLLFENPHFMSIFRNNFISKHHSYYDDTSLLLQLTVRLDYTYLSYNFRSLSGDRFENLVKLDCPNPFQEDDPNFDILDSGSINGILCLYPSNFSDERVVLWNPATEEFKVTPPSPSVESVPKSYWDPFVVLHGFGYDHLRDDYKLIRYVRFFMDTLFGCCSQVIDDKIWEIYSVRSNSWRKLDVDMPHCLRRVPGERVYMDGMCHWWGLGSSETYNGCSPNSLYFMSSFDLSNEVFFITPIPLDIDILSDIDDFDSELVERHLVVLNGSIALISWYFGTTTFHISVLGEIGVKESWTKLFIVGPLPCIERPIGVGKKGDIFFRRTDGELVWFDLSTQMIEELGVKGEYSHVVIYKESPFPIGGIHH